MPYRPPKQKKIVQKYFTRLNDFLSEQPTQDLSDHEISLLDRATELARTSHNPRFKVGAIIAERGKVISYGVNQLKTHPFQAKWNQHSSCLHAEMDALLTAQRLSCFDPHKSTVIVSRIGSNKKTDCSYPCKYCYPALAHVGIRRFVCYDIVGNPVKIVLDR